MEYTQICLDRVIDAAAEAKAKLKDDASAAMACMYTAKTWLDVSLNDTRRAVRTSDKS